MSNSRFGGALLAISLVVNVALSVALVVSAMNARKAINEAVLAGTEQSLRLDSEILKDLESGDISRLEAAKSRLRTSIAIRTRISYNSRTGAVDRR